MSMSWKTKAGRTVPDWRRLKRQENRMQHMTQDFFFFFVLQVIPETTDKMWVRSGFGKGPVRNEEYNIWNEEYIGRTINNRLDETGLNQQLDRQCRKK